jgi:signal transduction histidine kinase
VPVIAGIEASRSDPTHLTALALGAGAIVALVLLRVFGLLGAAERLRGSERAARSEAEHSRRVVAERNRRLEELDRLKDTFIASVSHELRTPLTSILGNLELAMEDETGADAEQRRRPLRVIARNAERLAALVEDLLFVVSTRAGGLELSLEEVDVAAVARVSLETFSAAAAQRGIELVLRADPPHPSVLADRRRVGQIVDNVLDNALKFTPAGRVELRVMPRGTGALLEVEDTGIGISAEDRRRSFEPFYRGAAAITHGIGGTGLGLNIAQTIVEAHGGTIEFERAQGEGTICRIVLPAEPPDLDDGAD